MGKFYVVRLSSADRERLLELAKSPKTAKAKRLRVNVPLKADVDGARARK